MRTIKVVNQSSVVSAADFVAAVAALQIQLTRDFAPIWGVAIQVVAAESASPAEEQIQVLDNSDQAGALGYHTESSGLVPIGFVFAKTSLTYGDSWSATLSHEALEQAIDPSCAMLAMAPWMGKQSALAYEVADAVENSEYAVGSVILSNFVTPAWFVAGSSGPYDFLRRLSSPLVLDNGGYMSWTRNLTKWQQTFADHTPAHQRTFEPLSRRGRRSVRHQRVAA